ncbi:TatD family hydrolase [Alteromonas sp. ASW11-130]|uniref:TatD family hydrolase n=1 Tax=Alteromonas sp. ASW11-130 TaxID=3015775 RepID=UPI0022427920|nr:TatD family hydrolase [Alteromonas sp. ASW11-130]MCW8092894.1 TatD family hydrolase [Alteromonas sp. ASW11-130]
MIDSHCHLDLPEFKTDLKTVLKQSSEAGVTRFLIPGTTQEGWQRQLTIQNNFPQCDIAFGLHPYFLTDEDDSLSQLQCWVEKHRHICVAIGEIGLDATVNTPLKKQQELFLGQLELAQQFELPVIMHHRKTHHLLIEGVKKVNFKYGGVIHAFSGSEEVARQYIDRGFLLGIGGTITYPRASKTRQTVSVIPLEYLLLETDAPDMPMQGRQGQRNSPAFISDVAKSLAELKNLEKKSVISQTTENYWRLFNVDG